MSDDPRPSFQAEAARLADAARDRASDVLEEFKLASNQVVDKVRDLIEEGNVRRISLRKGERTLFEIPLTVGVGAGAAALVLSPLLAAVGAVAALVADITLVVERDPEAVAKHAAGNAADAVSDAADTAADTVASAADTATEAASDAADAVSDAATKTVGRPTPDAD
jgi:hypothetical protein